MNNLIRHQEALRRYLWALEQAQKGTAPSYFNLEASNPNQAESEPPISSKGERRLQAELDQRLDDGTTRDPSSQKIRMALSHCASVSTRCALALARCLNEPGHPRCWAEGSQELADYRLLLQMGAEFVERIFPGTRLYVPLRRDEEPFDGTVRQESEQRRRWGTEESYRRIVEMLRALEAEYGDISREAAKEELSKRRGYSVSKIEKALKFVADNPRPEEAA